MFFLDGGRRDDEETTCAPGAVTALVQKADGAHVGDAQPDLLAVEEPLQIRLALTDADGARSERALSVTMRTPGHDFELAAGFLLTEGIVAAPVDVARIRHQGPLVRPGRRNTVLVELAPGVQADTARLERHFYTTSSCGVCGKTSIAAVETVARYELSGDGPIFDPAVIHALPGVLRDAQAVFAQTGGLHAAALFAPDGRLLLLREDVGRHNAVDKIVGAQFLANALPLSNCLLLVSGRASFELVQKALMAGIPALAAVGAPSSLAVELARDRNLTLLGFVRNERFNIYSGAARIQNAPA